MIFDTFDGGSVTLAEADVATIDRLFDAIAPIDAPTYESAETAEAWLDDDDLIVAYTDPDGGTWAYPIRILDRHEIVNDELARQPVLITWCPLCGSGVVYDRTVDGTVRSFSNTSALHDNDLVMVDRETGTYWWQVAGRAIVGTDTGAQLAPLPAQTTAWAAWRDAHPDTAVLARPTDRDYSAGLFDGYDDRVDSGQTPFPVSKEALADDRLAPSTRVVVLETDDGAIAWPVDPERTQVDTVDGQQLSIDSDGVGAVITEKATGDQLPTRTSMWFAVAAAYPDVELRPVD